jgi:hypothetical protein
MGSDPPDHGPFDQADHDRSDRYGRHRVADQHARGDAEGEREGGVADRHDAARAEHRRLQPVHTERVERVDLPGPPALQQAEQAGGGHAGQADQGELDG